MKQSSSILIYIICVVLLTAAGCKGAKKSKENLLEKGKIYENIKQYGDAIKQYDEALKQDPFYLEAYLRKGKCLKEMGNFKEALAVTTKGIVLDTNSIPILQSLAEIHYLMGHYEESLSNLQKLRDQNPNDPFASNFMGKVKAAQGELEESEKWLRRAVTEAPDNRDFAKDLVYFLSARREWIEALNICDEFLKDRPASEELEVRILRFDLLVALNRLDEAEKLILNLEQKKPKDPEITLRIGQLHFYKEDFTGALKAADQALVASPNHVPSMILKGTTLLRQKKGKESLLLWQALASHYPNLPEVQFKLGAAYELVGQYEQAKTAYQRLVQMAPDFIPGQLALAQVYFRDGRHEEVKKICDKILEKNPDHLDALKIYAASLLMQNKYAEAIPVYQKITSLSPEMERNHSLMAELYLANRNFEAAYREAQEALRQTPNDSRMLLLSGIALRYLGFIPQAQSLFAKLLEQEPDYLPARFHLAEIYFLGKLWSPAEEQYQKILEKHPDNREALLRLGKLYFLQGQKEKAETYFLDLLKKYPEDTELSFELGKLYADQKRIPEAIEKFKAVVDKTPQHVLGNLLLANLCRQNGDFEKAEEHLRKLYETKASLNLENDLALLMVAQEKEGEALQFIKSLSIVSQQLLHVQLTKGFAFLLTDLGEDAAIVFNRLEDQFQADLIFAVIEANAFFMAQNPNRAREIFHAEMKDFPETLPWYQKWMGDLEKAEDKKKALKVFHSYLLYSYYQWNAQAESFYQEVSKLFPASPLLGALRIKELAQQQKWEEALSFSNEAIRKEPANSFLHFQQAGLLWQKGDISSAVTAYYGALNQNPKSVLIRVNLIQLLTQQRRWREAERLCRETMEQSPERSEAYYLLAQLLIQQGRWQDIVSALKDFYAKKPDEMRAALLLGQCYFNLHAYDKSAEVLKEVVRRQPKNLEANTLYLRALLASDLYSEAQRQIVSLRQNLPQIDISVPQMVIYLKQGLSRDAMGVAQKTQTSTLVTPVSLYVMGLVYQANAHFDQARKYFAAGAEKTQDSLLFHLAYLNLAKKDLPSEEFQKEVKSRIQESEGIRDYVQMLEALLQNESDDEGELFSLNLLYLSVLNQWDKQALDDLLERLKDFPRNLFFYRIAFFLCDRNRWGERELEILKTQLEYYPKDELALMQLARLHLSLNHPDEALALFERELEINPENEEALVFSGMIYAQKENHAKAHQLYEKALQINPNNVVALNNLSYLYASQKPLDLEKAAQLAEQAQKLSPESGAVADTLGWIYFQQGRYAEALVQLERARQAIPQVAEVRYHLGKTYLQLKDEGNAKNELSEALRLDPQAPYIKEVTTLLESLK